MMRRGRWDAPDDPPPGAVTLIYRENQAAVRRWAADRARRAGLAPERVGDLVIAVGELAGNTLLHTSGPGSLSIWVADGEIICQVQDSGQISDPLAGTRRLDAADPGRGRGLWVVNQLCDLVEKRTGASGTTVRLHMRLPAERGPEQLGTKPLGGSTGGQLSRRLRM
jgi:anti-sigma regulatory factor (Ser/Thr protein kinase)